MALIIPEVFADAVNAKLDASLRIGRVAFDATPNVSEAMQDRKSTRLNSSHS